MNFKEFYVIELINSALNDLKINFNRYKQLYYTNFDEF